LFTEDLGGTEGELLPIDWQGVDEWDPFLLPVGQRPPADGAEKLASASSSTCSANPANQPKWAEVGQQASSKTRPRVTRRFEHSGSAHEQVLEEALAQLLGPIRREGVGRLEEKRIPLIDALPVDGQQLAFRTAQVLVNNSVRYLSPYWLTER